MKKVSAMRPSIGDTVSGSRQRLRMMRRISTWTIVLVSLAGIFLLGVYIHPPRNSIACSVFSSGGCAVLEQHPSQELIHDQIAAQVVLKEILKIPPIQSKNPKIAFMFLASGSLPFEEIWDNFFRGHEGRFSVYVHSSNEKPVHVSPYFEGRDIRSEKVVWGKISMVDAEKRLLANALLDPDNQQFVLLSESCIPLHGFQYVYHYLIYTNVSFIDCILDPGPNGVGRYSERMFPEVKIDDFRKASQWFSLKRQHAVMVISDSFYYRKFSLYCRPNMDGQYCFSDEHYFATLFHMTDPAGISNWSVTHVDWSEENWHPKTYMAPDVTYELLKNIASLDESIKFTSEEKKRAMVTPCLWNGKKRPCFLFARKFHPETLGKLMYIFSNPTSSTP
ncbi:hypothetical protein F2P56_017595 [Juglans regia]|uniref:Glycosyltransferase BC10-like n=2 Tax=Juglans regia TaxID=51240 RepID=A0A833TK98_JUGRE|nr:glycosyltransferase BC10-like [Juglans regia]KAF5461506.1 hypothetical protein F2P56_017595 [Juglans regia]